MDAECDWDKAWALVSLNRVGVQSAAELRTSVEAMRQLERDGLVFGRTRRDDPSNRVCHKVVWLLTREGLAAAKRTLPRVRPHL